jgi:hypothetical protein
MRSPSSALAACFVLLLAACAVGQTIYQWTDENGVIHFGHSPPPDAAGAEVRTLPEAPAAESVVGEGAPAQAEETVEGEEAAAPQVGEMTEPASATGQPPAPPRSAPSGPAKVRIESHEARRLGPSEREIAGTVRNVGGQVAEDIVVLLRVLDDNGECLQEEIEVEPATLEPGRTGTFFADFDNPCFFGSPEIDLETDWNEREF